MTDTVDLKPFGFVLVCLSPRGAENRLAIVAVGPLTPEGSRERSYYKRHDDTNLVQTLGRCQALPAAAPGALFTLKRHETPHGRIIRQFMVLQFSVRPQSDL